MATEKPDLETLARALARIADLVADAIGLQPDHRVKEVVYGLRREAAALFAPFAPPAPPPPPPPPPMPNRDRSMDPPSPSEIVFVAAQDVDLPNLRLGKGEPYPEVWDKFQLCRLYPGGPHAWPPPWVRVEIRRAPSLLA
jgi:hypothetical protein